MNAEAIPPYGPSIWSRNKATVLHLRIDSSGTLWGARVLSPAQLVVHSLSPLDPLADLLSPLSSPLCFLHQVGWDSAP